MKNQNKLHKPLPKKENKKADAFPMRINKYLAHHRKLTRIAADKLVEKGLVKINGKRAVLGSKVQEGDQVELGQKEIDKTLEGNVYFAYHKPIGLATEEIAEGLRQDQKLFPVGRLDKKSHGLIIVTNDGRITDKLLNPEYDHEKEYVVETVQKLPSFFQRRMEEGIKIDEYTTKPAKVVLLGDSTFSIVLIEGKKHQIRRMCEALKVDVKDLKRIRIMNIYLGKLGQNQTRSIDLKEKEEFLKSLGL